MAVVGQRPATLNALVVGLEGSVDGGGLAGGDRDALRSPVGGSSQRGSCGGQSNRTPSPPAPSACASRSLHACHLPTRHKKVPGRLVRSAQTKQAGPCVFASSRGSYSPTLMVAVVFRRRPDMGRLHESDRAQHSHIRLGLRHSPARQVSTTDLRIRCVDPGRRHASPAWILGRGTPHFPRDWSTRAIPSSTS